MIWLRGADIVLPDRVLTGGMLAIDGEQITAIEERSPAPASGETLVDLAGSLVVPGFVDVHVHGVEGHDVLDGPGAIARVAARLPRYGVTAFCPTSIGCDPKTLGEMLEEIAALSATPPALSARVLPAHLESNFISEAYRGAQPLRCLRVPRRTSSDAPASQSNAFSSSDILEVIKRYRSQVAIVTLAPELDGGIALVEQLSAAGHRVSIGHSGATYEQALTAIEAGVSHATHLFNRMTPMTHRAPGIPGAVLQSDRVCAELICDGFHVHPAVMQLAIRLKGPNAIVAITDGTAGSGLPPGSRTRLGGQPIIVTARTAELEDGTFAGSVSTMEATFRHLVRQHGVSVVDAARMCATTPAKQLRLGNSGQIAVGATADLVVLDRSLRVTHTYLRGGLWRNMADAPVV
jgi:N-acetylglucosamine-6-phosphate deacetylase